MECVDLMSTPEANGKDKQSEQESCSKTNVKVIGESVEPLRARRPLPLFVTEVEQISTKRIELLVIVATLVIEAKR